MTLVLGKRTFEIPEPSLGVMKRTTLALDKLGSVKANTATPADFDLVVDVFLPALQSVDPTLTREALEEMLPGTQAGIKRAINDLLVALGVNEPAAGEAKGP